MPRPRVWWLLGTALAALVAFRTPHLSLRSYEVQFGFAGYNDVTNTEGCENVNKQGYDSLTGTVRGMEPDGKSDDDVVYQGVLRRTTRLDTCDARSKPCVTTLTGEAQMTVQLQVHGDEGRGAWLNAKAVMGSVKNLKVEGDCAAYDMEQLRKGYPGGESGGSPDGQSIPESDPPKFFVGGMARLRVGYYPTEKDHPAWSLRVLRPVP